MLHKHCPRTQGSLFLSPTFFGVEEKANILTFGQSDIANKTAELGGIHKYDLTPDCTHLIVGDYDTPKYRHVAKERPDVKPMAAAWIEAVRNLWIEDADMDFDALEKEWQLRTFETGGCEPTPDGHIPERRGLLCCMTGFDDPEVRQEIIDKLQANGGVYTGDLTRRCTHLIVYKPEGRKYIAAGGWGIRTVSIEWLNDSIERGMILDEKCYDPLLPPEERGVGAWNKSAPKSSNKRRREEAAQPQEEGRRKLRKTASMKLNSQRDNLWGDILGKKQSVEPSPSVSAFADPPAVTAPSQPNTPSNAVEQPPAPQHQSHDTQGTKLSSFGVSDESVVFASCCFYIHGFSQKATEILVNTVASLGGLICHSLDEASSTSGAQLAHRFLIVPQSGKPESHPRCPENVHIVTEFYIERCLYKKRFLDPTDHVLGQPFPAFPVSGFDKLTVCTAGFTDVDLNQTVKAVQQLGAKYEERFTANVSVLVCHSLPAVRKQKLELALAWKVPVVSAEWLWRCILSGFLAPMEDFMFPELKQKLRSDKSEKEKANSKGKGRLDVPLGLDKDLLPKPAAKASARSRFSGIDYSAFAPALEKGSKIAETGRPGSCANRDPPTDAEVSMANTTFDTAPTHQFERSVSNAESTTSTTKRPGSAPLSEASSNSLNRPTSSQRKQSSQNTDKPQQTSTERQGLQRVRSEVADSDASDGDVAHPSDIPAEEAGAENNQVQEETEEEIKKRLAAEKAAKAAAEKNDISYKIVSLLDMNSSAASATTTVRKTTTTIPSPGGQGEREKKEEEEVTETAGSVNEAAETSMIEIGDMLAAAAGASMTTTITAGAENKANTGVRMRKRQVLGRAISNVSAASSTSESSGHQQHTFSPSGAETPSLAALATGVASPPPRHISKSKAASTAGNISKTATEEVISPPLADDDEETAASAPPHTTTATKKSKPTKGPNNNLPPSTQVEFEDTDAKRFKAQLMHKLLGNTMDELASSSTNGGSLSISASQRRALLRAQQKEAEEALTLASLKGENVEAQRALLAQFEAGGRPRGGGVELKRNTRATRNRASGGEGRF